MADLFNKPMYFRGLFIRLWAYFDGFRLRPKRKISEDLALEAFGFLEETDLKTFLKDSTI